MKATSICLSLHRPLLLLLLLFWSWLVSIILWYPSYKWLCSCVKRSATKFTLFSRLKHISGHGRHDTRKATTTKGEKHRGLFCFTRFSNMQGTDINSWQCTFHANWCYEEVGTRSTDKRCIHWVPCWSDYYCRKLVGKLFINRWKGIVFASCTLPVNSVFISSWCPFQCDLFQFLVVLLLDWMRPRRIVWTDMSATPALTQFNSSSNFQGPTVINLVFTRHSNQMWWCWYMPVFTAKKSLARTVICTQPTSHRKAKGSWKSFSSVSKKFCQHWQFIQKKEVEEHELIRVSETHLKWPKLSYVTMCTCPDTTGPGQKRLEMCPLSGQAFHQQTALKPSMILPGRPWRMRPVRKEPCCSGNDGILKFNLWRKPAITQLRQILSRTPYEVE